MKELIKRLEKAIERGNAADEKWENNPESIEAEEEFNRAYEEEYAIRKQIAEEITKLTKEIDFDTALKMTYNPKTIELIQMVG